MVKTILLIFLFLFVVLGICEAIYIIKMFFYYPGIRSSNYVIIVLNNDYALKQLNYISQKIKWHGDEYACGAIAITDYLDENVKFRCNEFVFEKNIVLSDLKSLMECQYLQGDF